MITEVERSSPLAGTPRSSMPSAAIMSAAAAPIRPGTKPTSSAGAPSARAARATLRPLPPGVTSMLVKRSTAPGRSSSSVPVRSIVVLGPAISIALDNVVKRRLG